MNEERHLVVELTRLVRALDAAADEDTRVQIAVRSAVSLVRGGAHGGFTVNEAGALLTAASSDDVVSRADTLQCELGEGPYLDVMRDQDALVSNDLRQEHRWPRWASRLHAELGVGSMMSLLVHTGRCSYGVLSLYADHRRAFDGDAVAVGQALASHLAVMIGTGRQIGQLEIAMQSRTIIGQAQGILMRDLNMSADRAFDYLRRLSSESNRKLSVIAMEIAHTRQVPLPPRSGRLAAS
ncbi:GAF and ANTAR domain-containing protein [Nocardioides sp. GCM10028917]|uniref:GAF and ANTAR domain-containing protein n=1 Tax=Nocardioides sp. GCM10028917 TaxID=3273408 RepID=UPI0036215CB8